MEQDKKQESPPATWSGLGLSENLLKLLQNAGFRNPTPIQAQSIPAALAKKDLIAGAKTGSGKTAAFCLPIIQALEGRRGTYAVILCPTREIALQTLETLKTFGDPLGITSCALIGGTDLKADLEAIRSVPHVIVGTPGRICDHILRGNLWLEFIEILVLDEADKMLDMGFAKELNQIVGQTQPSRQTLLFSATIPPTIEQLANKILRNPTRIQIGNAGVTVPENVQHEILWVNDRNKKRELLRLLRDFKGTVIIFSRTKDGVTLLWRSIHAAGIEDSTYISSNKLQVHREAALKGFKEGEYRVLVATDVAGRGIHVDDVGLVINYDLPMEAEDYVHRIGRTGRKDAKGIAVSFCTAADLRQVQAIETFIKQRIPERFTRDFEPPRAGSESRGTGRTGSASRGPRASAGRASGGRSAERRSTARTSKAHAAPASRSRHEPRPRSRSEGHGSEPIRHRSPVAREEVRHRSPSRAEAPRQRSRSHAYSDEAERPRARPSRAVDGVRPRPGARHEDPPRPRSRSHSARDEGYERPRSPAVHREPIRERSRHTASHREPVRDEPRRARPPAREDHYDRPAPRERSHSRRPEREDTVEREPRPAPKLRGGRSSAYGRGGGRR